MVKNIGSLIYVKLQSLIWIESGKGPSNVVHDSTSERIKNIIKSKKKTSTLVIDCKRVREIANYAIEDITDAIQSVRSKGKDCEVILINADKIKNRLEKTVEGVPVKYFSEEVESFIARIGAPELVNVDSVHDRVREIEEELLTSLLSDSFKKWDESERLPSTPVKSTGVFDARYIISKPKCFAWLSTLLADKVENIITNELVAAEPKLLAVSLRASPLAAAVGNLLEYDIEVVDHLGPVQNLMVRKDARRYDSRSVYFYIGDFAIGGTEIKNAATFVQLVGKHMAGAVTIGSALDESEYDFKFPFTSLVRLSKVRDDVEYKF